jgi:electron transport complex protein RnfG
MERRLQMAKKESTFKNMVLTLFLVTLFASSALALIYELTKGPIAEAKRLKKANAIGEVVPEFDNDPGSEMKKLAIDGDTLYFYRARKGDEVTGIAVESYTHAGFSGLIKVMVGFLPDGTMNDIAVLEHAETPGLGDKMEKKKSLDKNTGESWTTQFVGKDPKNFSLAVKQDKGDVDAITAATISSRAFCDAVQRAYDGLLVVTEELDIDSISGSTERHNAE